MVTGGVVVASAVSRVIANISIGSATLHEGLRAREKAEHALSGLSSLDAVR